MGVKSTESRQVTKLCQETLLKEYEVARSAFTQVEGNIWQSAAVFLVLSVGGVSVLLSIDEHSWASFLAVVVIGIISASVLWYWYSMATRWWGIEAVFLHRMREIEEQLGMWTQRYLYYLDRTRIYQEPVAVEREDLERFGRLNKAVSRFASFSARSRVRALVMFLSLGWLLVVVRELLLATAPK